MCCLIFILFVDLYIFLFVFYVLKFMYYFCKYWWVVKFKMNKEIINLLGLLDMDVSKKN